jgi:hypothetical protein
MPSCVLCGEHFKKYSNVVVNYCLDCVDEMPEEDSETSLEVTLLMNPSGRTQPRFYDDEYTYDVDSFSS